MSKNFYPKTKRTHTICNRCKKKKGIVWVLPWVVLCERCGRTVANTLDRLLNIIAKRENNKNA